MEEIVLSFGSNHGERKENVEKALSWVDSILKDVKRSGVYETPEVHGYGGSYFNAVASGRSDLGYEEFNRRLKEYEKACGRSDEARRRKEVVIDIDIVIWGGEIIRQVDYFRDFFKIGLAQIENL